MGRRNLAEGLAKGLAEPPAEENFVLTLVNLTHFISRVAEYVQKRRCKVHVIFQKTNLQKYRLGQNKQIQGIAHPV